MSEALWKPSKERVEGCIATEFCNFLESNTAKKFNDFHELYDWSIKEPEAFWLQLWKFFDPIYDGDPTEVLRHPDKMPGAEWFPNIKLSYAENLLKADPDKTAIVFWNENGLVSKLAYSELRAKVISLANWMLENGIQAGDRVAGLLPNAPEAIIALLAANSIGAVWASCSPDFGIESVCDRFGQIEPKLFIFADGYLFKGKQFNTSYKSKEIIARIPSIKQSIVVDYINNNISADDISVPLFEFEELTSNPVSDFKFKRLAFDHPLYILFSSGTTGKPKCMVHSAGGSLIEHLKELAIHSDVKPTDNLFYQTTTSWMMWNWLVTGLACDACLILFDGYPFANDGKILFDLAESEGITIFGTNPRYLSAVEKSGIKPRENHNLSKLKSVLSTGAPLLPENYDFVYRDIKPDVCLSSISGGTDIVGCFALGCPALPVHISELQTRSLGLKVEVYDENAQPVVGEQGELVCSAPFPSMPVYFWNDEDGSRYKKAYFEFFPGVWRHGDFVKLTENNGMIFYGRSDAVLNPGGVRIGTAEIYSQTEKFPEILESVVVGQKWDDDMRIVLFVKLAEGVTLNEELVTNIKSTIKLNVSPRHIPKKIIQVPDIPRTHSGKIVELAVQKIIHNQEIQNKETLANPESLEHFKDITELSSA